MTPRLKSRRYGKSGHVYYLDGEKVPGVTTILNALPKQLTQWAADTAASYAMEHWDELAEMTLLKRGDAMRYAHRDTLARAAARGTEIHHYGEKLVTGEPVEIPEEYLGPATAYAKFLDNWQITPVAMETPVANTRHGYAGTADLWATVGVRDNARALIDLKTGKGIYESVVLQLVAYRNATIWQPDGPDTEDLLPPVDLVYVAHILPDDVRMLPVEAGPQEFRQFQYVQQTARWLERHGFKGEEPLIGDGERP